MLNPLAVVIDGFRKAIISGVSPNWDYVGIAGIITIIMLVTSCMYFKKAEKKFADII